MVGKDGTAMPLERTDNLRTILTGAHPELDAVRRAAGSESVYLVGGAVRDLLLGRVRTDVDIVVVGEAGALASRLGAEPLTHERFGTAKVMLDGYEVDIATARMETYEHPGALPTVTPADDIAGDLGRRDFSINAMAIPVTADPQLIDPYGGRADLEAGRLRALSPHSFEDDPTRALRAARYAARFGFQLERDTETSLRRTDLDTVSDDRREAELLKLAEEPTAPDAFHLLAGWGLLDVRPEAIELAARTGQLLEGPPWQGFAPRSRAVLAAAVAPPPGAGELAKARPERPSDAVALAAHRDPLELAVARALGAEWLDEYLERWRSVELEIDGSDLIEAGIEQGPALGRGLAAARRRKLDGEIAGRSQELDAALAAARAPRDGVEGRDEVEGRNGMA